MMKKSVLVAASVLFAGIAQAQSTLGCVDQALRVQAEQIKRDFKPQGFVSVRDMMINMKSKEAAGIPLVLTQGKLYQLVFIGSKESESIQFGLFDKAKFKIDERKLDKPSENNLLIYSMVPEKTDTFVVAITQSSRIKAMCGSFTVLRQDEIPQQAPAKQPAKGNTKPAAKKSKANRK